MIQVNKVCCLFDVPGEKGKQRRKFKLIFNFPSLFVDTTNLRARLSTHNFQNEIDVDAFFQCN